jgi:hypothetical protein
VWLAAAIVAATAAGSMVAAERSSASMASAATRFLSSLTPEQRKQATFAFDSDERMHWHFIPTGPAPMFPRNGLTIKEMNEAQRKAAHELLKAGLSAPGYRTASAIMDLETVLGALESAQRAAAATPPRTAPIVRDPERYFFSVFGTPSTKDTWGWRVEGHHVSLQFTVVKGTLVAGAPTFFGSNPAEVREGPKKGLRILGAEEDAARALVESLDAAQREKALINSTAPNDMVTMNQNDIKPLSPTGITADTPEAESARDVDEVDRHLYRIHGRRHRGGPGSEAEKGRRRQDRLRVGWAAREGTEALLPRAGPDLPDRVRQHPERR